MRADELTAKGIVLTMVLTGSAIFYLMLSSALNQLQQTSQSIKSIQITVTTGAK